MSGIACTSVPFGSVKRKRSKKFSLAAALTAGESENTGPSDSPQWLVESNGRSHVENDGYIFCQDALI